jgi:hypothetical protein
MKKVFVVMRRRHINTFNIFVEDVVKIFDNEEQAKKYINFLKTNPYTDSLIDEWYVMDYNLYEDCETAIKNAWG